VGAVTGLKVAIIELRVLSCVFPFMAAYAWYWRKRVGWPAWMFLVLYSVGAGVTGWIGWIA